MQGRDWRAIGNMYQKIKNTETQKSNSKNISQDKNHISLQRCPTFHKF